MKSEIIASKVVDIEAEQAYFGKKSFTIIKKNSPTIQRVVHTSKGISKAKEIKSNGNLTNNWNRIDRVNNCEELLLNIAKIFNIPQNS